MMEQENGEIKRKEIYTNEREGIRDNVRYIAMIRLERLSDTSDTNYMINAVKYTRY